MTTAARPTFNPARGGHSIREKPSHPVTQYYVQDLPSYTTLKMRQSGQNTEEEIRKRNLKEELKKAELEHFKNTGKRLNDEEEETEQQKEENDEQTEHEQKKLKIMEQAKELDDESSANESEAESEEESESDDESDTEELLRELEKIKREKQMEKEKEEQERLAEEERLREEEILMGNPLTAPQDFTVKRRWDDDVVFRNQAKGLNKNPPKRFVNDFLRSDFHKKFMSKYIK